MACIKCVQGESGWQGSSAPTPGLEQCPLQSEYPVFWKQLANMLCYLPPTPPYCVHRASASLCAFPASHIDCVAPTTSCTLPRP